MIGLIQRVSEASVAVESETVASISKGLLVLVGVEKGDAEAQAERLLERLLGYRVFPDAEGRMNLSVSEIGGGLLLAPQFTLAAEPEEGKRLFEYLAEKARQHHADVQCGIFGADMQVSLTNDGPVTFWLQAS